MEIFREFVRKNLSLDSLGFVARESLRAIFDIFVLIQIIHTDAMGGYDVHFFCTILGDFPIRIRI